MSFMKNLVKKIMFQQIDYNSFRQSVQPVTTTVVDNL